MMKNINDENNAIHLVGLSETFFIIVININPHKINHRSSRTLKFSGKNRYHRSIKRADAIKVDAAKYHRLLNLRCINKLIGSKRPPINSLINIES